MGKLSENELKGNAQSDQDLGEVIGGETRGMVPDYSKTLKATEGKVDNTNVEANSRVPGLRARARLRARALSCGT